MMCTGMNPTSRTTPGISLAIVDGGAMTAAASPVASVATTPIESRANSIGRVNVILSATLAYAGHDTRMIAPATVTTIIHTASSATTPRIFLAIVVPLERSEMRVRESAPDLTPSDRQG